MDVLFESFAAIEQASYQMRARNWSYEDAGTHPEGRKKSVWLDRAKTRAEQRPTRMVHQAHFWISQLEKPPNRGGIVT